MEHFQISVAILNSIVNLPHFSFSLCKYSVCDRKKSISATFLSKNVLLSQWCVRKLDVSLVHRCCIDNIFRVSMEIQARSTRARTRTRSADVHSWAAKDWSSRLDDFNCILRSYVYFYNTPNYIYVYIYSSLHTLLMCKRKKVLIANDWSKWSIFLALSSFFFERLQEESYYFNCTVQQFFN